MLNMQRLMNILSRGNVFKPAPAKRLEMALERFECLMDDYGYYTALSNLPGDVYIAIAKVAHKTGIQTHRDRSYINWIDDPSVRNDGLMLDRGTISLIGLVFRRPDSLDDCLVVEMRFPSHVAMPRNREEWPRMLPNAISLEHFLSRARKKTPAEIFDDVSWGRQLAEEGMPPDFSWLRSRTTFEEPHRYVKPAL